MKYSFIKLIFFKAAALLLIPFSTTAFASQVGNGKKLGFGLGIGSTSALTAKYYMSSNRALQIFFGSGGYLGGRAFSVAEVDYLIETTSLKKKPLKQKFGNVFLGYGFGAKFYSYGGVLSNHVGLVGILEGGVHFNKKPVELVLDIRPDISFGSMLTLSYTYGGAVRYYF